MCALFLEAIKLKAVVIAIIINQRRERICLSERIYSSKCLMSTSVD